MTETEIESLMAEVIIGVVKKPAHKTNIKVFREENHLDRTKLTSKKLFSMTNCTLFRIMLGVAHLVPLEEFLTMCIRIAIITYYVSNKGDGSAEAIIKAHEGSPIERKQYKKQQPFN